jgi:hypothetical protein
MLLQYHCCYHYACALLQTASAAAALSQSDSEDNGQQHIRFSGRATTASSTSRSRIRPISTSPPGKPLETITSSGVTAAAATVTTPRGVIPSGVRRRRGSGGVSEANNSAPLQYSPMSSHTGHSKAAALHDARHSDSANSSGSEHSSEYSGDETHSDSEGSAVLDTAVY